MVANDCYAVVLAILVRIENERKIIDPVKRAIVVTQSDKVLTLTKQTLTVKPYVVELCELVHRSSRSSLAVDELHVFSL